MRMFTREQIAAIDRLETSFPDLMKDITKQLLRERYHVERRRGRPFRALALDLETAKIRVLKSARCRLHTYEMLWAAEDLDDLFSGPPTPGPLAGDEADDEEGAESQKGAA